jgi:hypothetical protein
LWKGGVCCVRLNQEPSACELQPIVVGIDPGSKKEARVVKSTAHTYLNIQADAITWGKDAMLTRSQMRRARRGRSTVCRQPRANRLRNSRRVSPSTKTRWQWKLRRCRRCQRSRRYRLSAFMVDDIKAISNGKRRWDRTFSPLEGGKQWYYQERAHLAPVQTQQG